MAYPVNINHNILTFYILCENAASLYIEMLPFAFTPINPNLEELIRFAYETDSAFSDKKSEVDKTLLRQQKLFDFPPASTKFQRP